jgi:hypothetical protein
MTTWRLVAAGAAVAVALAAGTVAWWTRTPVEPATLVDGAGQPIALDTAALAPTDIRVRVQVLNGTDTPGLARRGTQRLRDHGYDVVDFGNHGERGVKETQVTVTAASRAWGERVVRALGTGRVIEREGPLPYVDLVVLLGADWQPPPQPLRP